jgi:hypothetical protein
VSITGSAIAGQTLSASAWLEGEGGVSYQWQRGETADGGFASIEGAIYETYLIDAADVGLWIRVSLVREGYHSLSSEAVLVTLPLLTGSVSITGLAITGQTLSASAWLEDGGEFSYQWQRGESADGEFAPIEGAIYETYLIDAADAGLWIRVSLVREGYHSLSSEAVGPVTLPLLTGSVSITGEAVRGVSLGLNTTQLEGTGTITYQWLRGDTADGEFAPIEGAAGETYIIDAADVDKYIKAAVTREGYSGSVTSEAQGPVTAPPLPGSVNIIVNGEAAKVDAVLSVNIDLLGGIGTIIYQWLRGDTADGDFAPIEGAAGETYRLRADDVGKYINVFVTRPGYSGGVTAGEAAGAVQKSQLTGSVSIYYSGAAKLGTILRVDTTQLPGEEKLTYQWQISAGESGTYADIPGETNETYVPGDDALEDKYINVTVGRDGYEGAATSNAVGPLAKGEPLTGSVSIYGEAVKSGTPLNVDTSALNGQGDGELDYQWRISAGESGTYADIPGAAGKGASYIPTDDDAFSFIKVIVRRNGYTGSAESAAAGPVAERAPLSGSVSIYGAETAKSGTALYVNTNALDGKVSLVYQWQISDAADGAYTDIPGATGESYTPKDDDAGKYIRVTVTQAGFKGNISSAPSSLVAERAPLTGTISIQSAAKVGTALSVNTNALGGIAALKYQWQISGSEAGDYEDTPGAAGADYTPVNADLDKFIRVVVKQDGFKGEVISNAAGPVGDQYPLTGSVSITGEAKYGGSLGVNTDALGGIVALQYQWQISGSAGGTYTDISGATNANYTLNTNSGLVGKYIKVVVTQDGFRGNVTSAAFGPVKPNVKRVTVTGSGGIMQNGSGTYTAVVEVLPDESQYKGVTWSIVPPGKTGVTGNSTDYDDGAFTVSAAKTAALGDITVKAVSSQDTSKEGELIINIKAEVVWTQAGTSGLVNAEYGQRIFAIAYGGEGDKAGFVAAGSDIVPLYSKNGQNWDKLSNEYFDGSFLGIAYGDDGVNAGFVAVRNDGQTFSSTDGASWTSRTKTEVKGSESFAMSIAYGEVTGADGKAHGRFVAVGMTGKAAYSTDGVTWTAVSDTNFGGSDIRDIAFGGGKFVAVGMTGKAAYSTDGVSWTAVSDTKFGTATITGISYGAGKFVAVGAGGKSAYSTDGVTWTAGGATGLRLGTGRINIAFGGGEFIAVSDNNETAYSLDGINWMTGGEPGFENAYNIVFGNGKFIAVGGGEIAYYSTGN